MSVSLGDLKEHLRLDGSDEDGLLDIYLKAAISFIEKQTGRYLTRVSRNKVVCQWGEVPLFGDNVQVDSVSYIDQGGDNQSLSLSNISVISGVWKTLTLADGQQWPTIKPQTDIVITYTSGYDANTIPDLLKAAVLIEAATMYEFRENESIVKIQNRKTVERLYHQFIIHDI